MVEKDSLNPISNTCSRSARTALPCPPKLTPPWRVACPPSLTADAIYRAEPKQAGVFDLPQLATGAATARDSHQDFVGRNNLKENPLTFRWWFLRVTNGVFSGDLCLGLKIDPTIL